MWEIWLNYKYIGLTESLQVAEIAAERGFRVVKVK